MSLLKVGSTCGHALEKAFPPAVLHCTLELELGDVSDRNIHCFLQCLHGRKADPPELLLDAGKKEKIRGGQVGRVRWVGNDLHDCLVAEVAHDVGSVWRGVVVLQPELVMAIPPKVTTASSHTLPHASQDVPVEAGVDCLALRNKFMVHDAAGIPESNQHQFLRRHFASDLGVLGLASFKPCAGLLLPCQIVRVHP